MSETEYLIRASLDPRLRSLLDKIKTSRGLVADSETLRVLIVEEGKRLGIAPCEA
jgi:hypothetical protein